MSFFNLCLFSKQFFIMKFSFQMTSRRPRHKYERVGSQISSDTSSITDLDPPPPLQSFPPQPLFHLHPLYQEVIRYPSLIVFY